MKRSYLEIDSSSETSLRKCGLIPNKILLREIIGKSSLFSPGRTALNSEFMVFSNSLTSGNFLSLRDSKKRLIPNQFKRRDECSESNLTFVVKFNLFVQFLIHILRLVFQTLLANFQVHQD